MVAVLAAGSLWAGGPNNVEYYTGVVARWIPADNVPFTIDNGPLRVAGSSVIYTREQGAEIVRAAAEKWNSVALANLVMRDNGFLNVDVNGDNWQAFISGGTHPENPIIFDADGKIIDDFFGAGASANTLGFAGVRFISGDGTRFLSGWAVLNGLRASPTSKTFLQTVTHEFGHFLGLDHSLGLLENWNDRALGFGDDVPLMFPIGSDTRLPEDPIEDDQAWLSWLYPVEDFTQQTATIRGRVARLRPGGPALQGANVAAVPAVKDSESGELVPGRENVVTCVSDFLTRGTGDFELPGLPPGCYFVRLDPIPRTISGIEISQGSNIGMFEVDERPTGFPREYYDLDESAADDPDAAELICLEAGEVLEGVEIVANEPDGNFVRLARNQGPTDLQLGDDTTRLVVLPDNFTFPFFGKIYREVFVNSDGNLTFGAGDARVGEPRTLDRFLAGPPRIAPLFTDLDPDAGGLVAAESGPGWVRFTWNQVPEYRLSGVAQPNTFSVMLFSDGGIRFEYQQINVTPDDDDMFAQGLHSVVGVSPGGSLAGQERDFSTDPDHELGILAIYQAFPDATFDLSGRVVEFSVSYSDLYFPLVLGDSTRFTGIALSNFGDDQVEVVAELRSDDGAVFDFPGNPVSAEVAAQQQTAQLGREWFGAGAAAHNGWARFRVSVPTVASFFEIANGLTGKLTYMDGSAAVTELSPRLYFTRVYEGPTVFPASGGFRDAVTWLAVVNPNDETAEVTLKLYNNFGQLVRQELRQIAANGRLYGNLTELFSLQSPVFDGAVEVVSSGPGLAGFEWIELPDTAIGLNAASSFTATTLYSAQLGHGQTVFTNLKLVNTTDELRQVTLTAYLVEDSGIRPVTIPPVVLGPRQTLQQNVEGLFNLVPGGSQVITGSIKVAATGPGIVGDVVFGEPVRVQYAAALPLQTETFREAVFSHVSNGVDNQRPWLSSFTGLALYNPNAAQAQITVQVFRYDGTQVGQAVVILPANGRISRLLTEPELVPASAGQMGGYIRVVANLPIVAQELFGNLALDFLSAVVPARVR
ncbi:MAG: hypothetical protein Kow00109_08410 [Acidobacteriota bacterium]